MSDYLTRLAERVAGVARSLEPRVPDRFEPDRSSLAGLARGEERVEQPRQVADVGEVRDSSTGGHPPPRPTGAGLQLPRAMEQSSRDDAGVEPQRTPATSASAILPEPRSRPVASPPAAARPAGTVGEARREVRPDRLQRRKDAKTTSELSGEDRAKPQQVALTRGESPPPQPARRADTRVQAARSEPVIPAVEVPRRSAAVARSLVAGRDETRPMVRPKDAVRATDGDRRDLTRAVAELPARRKAEPPQEPTVTVTIGRVEVRAVTEPPRPPARSGRAARTAISLAEYLERHEARRR